MSSVQARKEEILAKRAKLAEIKRQRELRQKEFTSTRQSLDPGSQLAQPLAARSKPPTSKEDLDDFVERLLDRPSSTTPGTPSSSKRRVLSDQEDSGPETPTPVRSYQDAATDTQTLSFTGLTTVYEIPVESKPEYITYSKGVQTTEAWDGAQEGSAEEGAEETVARSPSRRRRKLSQREQDLEEEQIRQRLRVEIEEELRALQLDEKVDLEKERFPARSLAPEELSAVTNSNDFLDFVERSSKVIERALDEEYDVLADYALQSRAA